jgi:hypothetical protein
MERTNRQHQPNEQESFPRSIRALFGTDNLINAVFGSSSTANIEILLSIQRIQYIPLTAIKELAFSRRDLSSTGAAPPYSCCKPDICGVDGTSSTSKYVEDIVQIVLWSGYQIVKREEFNM